MKFTRLFDRISSGSSTWVAIGTIFAASLSLSFQTLLSLVLEDSKFGDFSADIALCIALANFFAFGAQNVMLNWVNYERNELCGILSAYRRIWLLLVVMFSFLSTSLYFLGVVSGVKALLYTSFSSSLVAFTIFSASRQTSRDFRGVAIFLVAPEASKVCAAAALVLFGSLYDGSIYLYLGLVSAIMVLLASKLFQTSRVGSSCAGPSISYIVQQGLPYAMGSFFFMLYYRVPVVVFSWSGYSPEAGSLAIVYLFLTALLLLPTTYSQRFLLGRWHSIRENSGEQFFHELRSQTRQVLLFSVPIAIAWFFFFEVAIKYFYGDRYYFAGHLGSWFSVILILRSLSIPLLAATSVASLKWLKIWAIIASSLVSLIVTYAFLGSLGFVSGLISAVLAELCLLSGLFLAVKFRIRAL